MASNEVARNPRARHRIVRTVPSRAVARGALALAVTAAAAGTGVLSAGPATAAPVSLELRYTCAIPVVGERPGTVRVDADAPTSATTGRPTPTFAIRAAVPVSAADTDKLREAGITSVEGGVRAKVRVRAPEGDTGLTVPFPVARTAVPASGPLLVRTTGIAPSHTFGRPGRAEVAVGDLTMRVTARGRLSLTLDVPCRLDAGQNNVVATLDVTGKATGTDPSRTPGATAPGTTGPQRPDDGTAPQGSASPVGSLPATGTGRVTGLLLLAAGTVALGAVATAAARARSHPRGE